MKTLTTYLVVMFWAAIANAQQITVLDEAKIGFAPITSEVINDGDSYVYKVNETFQGEFEQDPLKFMNNYFDIQNFISEVKHQKFDSYEVTFKSSKGSFHANLNKEGEIVYSSHKLQDVILPNELRHLLYKEHKGWAMVRNVHIARGKFGTLSKNFYRIKLENGGKTKRIKMNGKISDDIELASK